jgi:hypothetical protein
MYTYFQSFSPITETRLNKGEVIFDELCIQFNFLFYASLQILQKAVFTIEDLSYSSQRNGSGWRS